MNSAPPPRPSEAIDLAGAWEFCPDLADAGLALGLAEACAPYPHRVRMPGTAAAQGFGEPPSMATAWTAGIRETWTEHPRYRPYQTPDNFKMPFWLQPPRLYVGPAWYRRTIEIPAAWAGRRVRLFLERPHWETTVWLDGARIGSCERLGVPHVFTLGADLAPGAHTLVLRIDNRMIVGVGVNSHSVSDHTQGNWNGAVGRIELFTTPASAWIEDVRVTPLVGRRAASVRVEIGAGANAAADLVIEARVAPASAPVGAAPLATAVAQADGAGVVELTLALGPDARLWDEFDPCLYELEVALRTPDGTHTRRMRFGLREVGVEGTRITINGRKVYLRGTLDCAAFPLSDHPPTEPEEWRRIFATVKAHGLNHVRFHSWCPPEAAFDVADELGVYCQIECSSWPNHGTEIGGGLTLDAWIEAEAEAVVREFGNHPSFVLMTHGNEPGGPGHVEWLRRFVARWKAADPRRLYTTGAGWPVAAGSDFHSSDRPRIHRWADELQSVINRDPPRSDYDWRDWVRDHPDAPTISHEVGQWCAHPDFDEIARYTGWFRAANFEVFRERAARTGVLDQARDFLAASGRLQALCYKADIEAALRTPGFGGFQLLGLNDFPGQGTAPVGVLNAFWEPKGYIAAEEFARFCGPVVPLVRLPRMIYTEGEVLEAEVELAHFGPRAVRGPVVWTLNEAGGARLAWGAFETGDLASGELHSLGSIVQTLPGGAARKLVLEVAVPAAPAANAWEIWVYPKLITQEERVPARLLIAEALDATAEAHLAAGGDVLWLPPRDTIAGDPEGEPLTMGFSPVFWNTVWTRGQAPHTLGLLCDPAHPALANFPTESHSNWQWWELVHDARPFVLTMHPGLRPIVQVIDDWVTARRLGLVFEARVGAGRVLACAADLQTSLETRPVARLLRTALARYMEGPDFKPGCAMDMRDLRALAGA